MIPQTAITAWREVAPWAQTDQIEHDLILSRAICDLYTHPLITEELAFRGGTALHKLFFEQAGRFSEDLDFVQIKAGPIGKLVNAIRERLDHWLGNPSWKQNQGRFTLCYAFKTEFQPIMKRKVKVEINTREHFTLNGHIKKPFKVSGNWFSGEANVTTYSLEELIGSKLRALYQRKKGRDLYDLWFTFQHNPNLNIDHVIDAFKIYMQSVNCSASRAEFEKNLHEKQQDIIFKQDIVPLLSMAQKIPYDTNQALELTQQKIISKLPGQPWKKHPEGYKQDIL